MNIILEGIVGSQAYGLATPTSDVDKLGVFMRPVNQLVGFEVHDESIQQHEPDASYHELRKYVSLVLKCNPTAMELLWLDDWTQATWQGCALVLRREQFLSTALARNAYTGYCRSQLTRFKTATVADRKPKALRHAMRLAIQCRALLTTGELKVRLSDADIAMCRLAEYGDERSLDLIERELVLAETCRSVLPEKPTLDNPHELILQLRGIA